MDTIALWILGILITIILGLIGYFLKENISVLKGLRKAVDDIVIRFAVHEESNKIAMKMIESHDSKIDMLEKKQVEITVKVEAHDEIIKDLRNKAS